MYCRNIISFTILYIHTHHVYLYVFLVVLTNILLVCVSVRERCHHFTIWSIIFNHLQAHKINSKLKFANQTNTWIEDFKSLFKEEDEDDDDEDEKKNTTEIYCKHYCVCLYAYVMYKMDICRHFKYITE